jgi:vacuolar fusion protein MON1
MTVDEMLWTTINKELCSIHWKSVIYFLGMRVFVVVFTRLSYGDEDRQASLMGAMHALVSFLQHSSSDSNSCDVLRSICAGRYRFVFLAREHLILVATTSIAVSNHALLMTLSYAYNQIISVLTYRRMDSVYSARKNYDLRRLLGGSERFMDCLLDALDTDPCYFLGAVRCLPLDAGTRDVISQTIAHYAKIKVWRKNYAEI